MTVEEAEEEMIVEEAEELEMELELASFEQSLPDDVEMHELPSYRLSSRIHAGAAGRLPPTRS